MRIPKHIFGERPARLSATMLWALLFGGQLAQAIDLDLTSEQSIIDAAGTAAYGAMAWYNANQTGGVPGNLPGPYYWWECGALFMTMIDYWYYTGDDTYNQQVSDGIQWQTGPNNDFMTPNQTLTEGNDDQAFWAFAALDAAELAFPNPSDDRPSWIALAQAVFNLQTSRWDTTTCAGGLRWQIYQFNAGYWYKNGISAGCYFNMGARLARYTANSTYSDLAARMWDWSTRVNIIDSDFHVWDGTDALQNCTSINHLQWTYNAGVFLHGAANMWNYTQDPIWKTRVDGLIAGLSPFFTNDVMVEIQCQPQNNCNIDQQSFKAYLSRWMAATTQLCPWTADTLMPYLQASAQGAAKQCSGGSAGSAQPGQTCGMNWESATWDGMYGPGEQMAALAVIGANLISLRHGPVTEADGGLSKSDPNAGIGTATDEDPFARDPITAGDKFGASILTIMVLVYFAGGCVWMVW